jgi:hypothetical protein
MNLIYTDVWSANPLDAMGNQINPDILYRYSGLTTASPTTLSCNTDWSWRCRSIINYVRVIHPLWNEPRLVVDANGDQVFNPDGTPQNDNCLNCHTPFDPVLAAPRVPAGQLNLVTGPSLDEADHENAYRELLVTDNLQVLDPVSGMVSDATVVVGQDANGVDILAFIPYASPASAGSARASSDFFDRFNDPNDQNHFNILSGAELRLIAEWLDVGAQYYNNPFDAPAN